MDFTVLELRNYLLEPDTTEHFIDYFEEHFISTQEAVGMYPLGQFRVIGDPQRFVWIRGFESMESRRNGLQTFYSGPVWAKHKPVANGMIVDSDNVLLLKPLTEISDLLCGWNSERVAAEFEEGTISPYVGVIAVERYQAAGQRDAMIEAFKREVLPIYARESIQVRGLLVAEMRENDYPRLPVFQNPDELVVITAWESEAAYRVMAAVIAEIEGRLGHVNKDVLLLRPTLRSPIRVGRK